jgi:hypothetical protein
VERGVSVNISASTASTFAKGFAFLATFEVRFVDPKVCVFGGMDDQVGGQFASPPNYVRV